MLNREECGALVTKRMQQVLIDSGLGDKPASRVTGLSNQTIRNIREGNYVLPPDVLICIDLDIKGEDGKKCFDKNFQEALKFPPTYAELSKSGEGIHLYYIYNGGDPYPYNIIADILDAGNKSDYQARRNIALLPVDEDVEKGLEEAMKRLTDREREFTLMYYRDGKTLEECGKKYGITRARAYQIISKSIRKLQHPSSRLLIIYGYKGFGARKRREAAERELHEARRLKRESRKVSRKDIKLNKE